MTKKLDLGIIIFLATCGLTLIHSACDDNNNTPTTAGIDTLFIGDHKLNISSPFPGDTVKEEFNVKVVFSQNLNVKMGRIKDIFTDLNVTPFDIPFDSHHPGEMTMIVTGLGPQRSASVYAELELTDGSVITSEIVTISNLDTITQPRMNYFVDLISPVDGDTINPPLIYTFTWGDTLPATRFQPGGFGPPQSKFWDRTTPNLMTITATPTTTKDTFSWDATIFMTMASGEIVPSRTSRIVIAK